MHEAAFDEFWLSVYPKLRGRALRRGFDGDTAHDLANDALRTLWDQDKPDPRNEDERRALTGLCFDILEGLIRNALRANRRRSDMEARFNDRTTVPDTVPDIADQVLDAIASALPGALEQLSESDQRLLSLLEDGYPKTEIAAILGCSRAALDTRLSRMRERARRLLEQGRSDGERS